MLRLRLMHMEGEKLNVWDSVRTFMFNNLFGLMRLLYKSLFTLLISCSQRE